MPVKALRSALAYAEKTLGIDRLLLSSELRADAGKVFLERYGELIELSASGQLAMRRLLVEHLKRIEWNDSKLPAKLYPFLWTAATSARASIASTSWQQSEYISGSRDPSVLKMGAEFLLDLGPGSST